MVSMLPRSAGEETFQSRLNLNEPFTQAQLLSLVEALAGELRGAHQAGRFHGAITPADIHYDEAGTPRLGGWGRDTTPNALLRSPYAPIECYAPVHPQGPWTDVYAVAAILWRAITGGPPADVLHRKGDVTLERMARSGYDSAFLRGVDAALAIAPQRRPHDVDSWLGLLAARGERSIVPAGPVDAPVESAASLASPVERSVRTPASWSRAALAAGVVAAVGGGIYFGTPTRYAPPAATPARVAERAEPALPAVVEPVSVDPVPLDEPREEVAEAAPLTVATGVSPPPAVRVAEAAPPPPSRAAEAPAEIAAEVPAAPAVAPAVAPAPVELPVALLRRADDELRDLYAAYAKLNAGIDRHYRSSKVAYPVKQQLYRDGRAIHAYLGALRDQRDRIAEADSFGVANRRYDALAEDITQVRDRIEMLRRSL